MTKNEALYKFYSGFGLKAFPESIVPDNVEFPFLTYENVVGNSGDVAISATATLWYKTDSEVIPNAKAEEISKAITKGGTTILYDDGAIWIKRGRPWCNGLVDENNSSIKRRILNIEIEFL